MVAVNIAIIAIILAVALIALVNCCLAKRLSILSYHSHQSVIFLTESNKIEFDADEVTIDFSYGVTSPLSLPYYLQEGDNFIGYGFYFCDGQHSSWQGMTGHYSDYTSIDNYNFVKEISYDEFRTDEYFARIPVIVLWPFSQLQFNHCEAITVPKEIFARENGTFVFQAVAVSYPKGGGGYYVENLGFITIGYEYLDEQTVLLSDISGSYPY